MKTWDLMWAWAAYLDFRKSDPKTAAQQLRQSQYFLSPNRKEFAPVRLLDERIRGHEFDTKVKNPTKFDSLRADLSAEGWIIVTKGHAYFNDVFEAWANNCCRDFGKQNHPRTWLGNDPKTARIFILPPLA